MQGNNLVPLDLEIEATCKRNNTARRKREQQGNQEPSSSISSSFPHLNFEKHIMAEDRPQGITLEDYSNTSTPQYFTSIADLKFKLPTSLIHILSSS